MCEIEKTIGGLKLRLGELGVEELFLFGSALRVPLRAYSDIDVVAEFATPSEAADHYFDVLFLLEDALGREVDLALPDTLHPKIRDRVLQEMKRVA